MSEGFYLFGITISSIGIILAIGFRVYILKELKRKYTPVYESIIDDYRIILSYKGEWEQNSFSEPKPIVVPKTQAEIEMDKYDTLQKIVDQLELCNYETEGGYLKNNVAFLSLKRMAELQS